MRRFGRSEGSCAGCAGASDSFRPSRDGSGLLEYCRDILRCQRDEGWGAKVVERLAKDLRAEFPQMHGFSRANLLSMRAFAEAYFDEAIVQHLVGQLPWGHNILLLAKVKNEEQRRVG